MENEMRDRLVELIYEAIKEWDFYFNDCLLNGKPRSKTLNEFIAVHLIENGVIVPPCKVGDTVYILEEKCKFSGEENKPWESCNQYWDNVFKNKMWGCKGKAKNGSLIYCKQEEMVWYVKEAEYSLFLYSNPAIVFGENLFLTKAEAEQKLKEMRGE